MYIDLFKCHDPALFVSTLNEALRSKRGGSVELRNDPLSEAYVSDVVGGWFETAHGVTTVMIDAPCNDVMTEVARRLESPRILVLFQEKRFWECVLEVDGETIAFISTVPGYWNDSSPGRLFGSVEDFARIWQIPVAKIDKYLVDWGLVKKWNEEFQMMISTIKIDKIKAYEGDDFTYGQRDQGFDFIKALGGIPFGSTRFVATVPPPMVQRA